jgi:HAMP domain-containing protein
MLRLMLVAVMVLVPPLALLCQGALGQFERALVREMDRKAEVVGRDLATGIEAAVALGIPLEKLVGMADFIGPVLEADPEMRYVAVVGPDGRIVFLHGVEAGLLAPHYGATDYSVDGDHPRKAHLGDFIDIAQPVFSKGHAVGQVHVGLDAGFLPGRLLEMVAETGAVGLVSLVVAFMVMLLVVKRNVSGPMRSVGRVMESVRTGDFTTVARQVSDDEVGRFVKVFNGTIRHADTLYRRLDAYAQEVQAAHFDPFVVERVSDVLARIRGRYRFSEVAESGPVVIKGE